MILTTHALIGAALGKNIQNPWIVAIVAVLLHFVFDHFRHGEYVESSDKKTGVKSTWWKIALDMLGAVAIIYTISYFHHFSLAIAKSMAIGVFFSILPDFSTVLYWKFRWSFLKKIHDFHVWCHRYPPFAKERAWNFRNARNDILFSVIAIILLVI